MLTNRTPGRHIFARAFGSLTESCEVCGQIEAHRNHLWEPKGRETLVFRVYPTMQGAWTSPFGRVEDLVRFNLKHRPSCALWTVTLEEGHITSFTRFHRGGLLPPQVEQIEESMSRDDLDYLLRWRNR